MLNGACEPCFCRKTDKNVGISCKEAVFITTNMAMLEFTVQGFLLVLFISFMAITPNGVAALPSPKKLAIIFIHIAFAAVLFTEYSGNKNLSTGEKNFERNEVKPLFSAIFINPLQRDIIPSIEITKDTESSAPERIEVDKYSILFVTIAQNTLVSTINAHM